MYGMQKVSSLTSKDISNYLTNQQTWGDILYNVKAYGAKGDGLTADQAAITSALNAASAAGGGVVYVPGGTYICNSALSVPQNVILQGSGNRASILNFSNTTTDVDCITLASSSRLKDIGLKGKDKTILTAVNCNGSEIQIHDIWVEDFKRGWRGTNENTYILTTKGSMFRRCGTCIDEKLAAAGTTNSGERIRFENCTFADSDKILDASGSTLDMFFSGGSWDYSTDFADFDNGQYYFEQVHFETDSARTPQGYLFGYTNGPNVRYSQCRFGMSGISFLDSVTGTSGFIAYQGCRCNFRPTGSGSDQLANSEHQVFLAGGATTTTFNSPFISRIVMGSVAIGFHNNNPAREVTTPKVEFAASSTLGTITFGAALASNTLVNVRFG